MMVKLAGPYEVFELSDKQSAELVITGYTKGEVEIHPRYAGAPERKVVTAMRVFVDPATKPTGPAWWDITSQTLIAQLEPFLAGVAKAPRRVKLVAHGVAPSKRYSVELVP
jgi:hypothetical protein